MRVLTWMILGMMCQTLLSEAEAGGWDLACPDNIKQLPRLVAGENTLEPSGVAWDPVNRVAVGVSDEASPYALFVFDPAQINTAKRKARIPVQPLMTKAQVEKYKPVDLEGITRQPNGYFVASASHGLNKNQARDTVLRFQIKKGTDGNWELTGLQRISPAGEGFRSWLTSATNPPWNKKFTSLEGENGTNAEGISASGQDDRLFLGFRGPTLNGEIPILSFRADADGQPRAEQWHLTKAGKGFDAGGLIGLGKEALGIRDFTPVEGSKAFLMLIGASGSGSDVPFQVGWWEEGLKEIQEVGKVPKGFRAEGLTILVSKPRSYTLLLVSDKDSMVMECQATRK